MKRCRKPVLKRWGARSRACLRRVVPGSRVCAKHHDGPLPEAERIRQTLDPLGDYVEAEIFRKKSLKNPEPRPKSRG